MNADLLPETIDLLTTLARRAEDLVGTLPALEIPSADLAEIAGEVQRINARLARIEERLASLGPTGDGTEAGLSASKSFIA
jgi:hypothetical protein